MSIIVQRIFSNGEKIREDAATHLKSRERGQTVIVRQGRQGKLLQPTWYAYSGAWVNETMRTTNERTNERASERRYEPNERNETGMGRVWRVTLARSRGPENNAQVQQTRGSLGVTPILRSIQNFNPHVNRRNVQNLFYLVKYHRM